MTTMLNRFSSLSRLKKVILLSFTFILVASVFAMSCGSSLRLADECTNETLFKGQKWKLRLLTTLYRPYSQYKPYVQKSVTAVKIEYPSTVNGEEMLLSGIVIIPHERKEELPILIYSHGTFFSKSYAPSKWNSAIQIQAIPAMDGYITFIPDYLGYGSSSDEIPAYFDQPLTVQNILDVLPTGLSYLDDCGIQYKKDLYMLGYSQGGHAAISVLKELESEEAINDLGLTIKATASIAAPFKLKENVEYILRKDTFKATAYVSYTFLALNHRYWHREMNEFFQDSSLYYIEEHLKGNVSLGKMAANQSDTIKNLVQDKFLREFLGDEELQLKESLDANSDFNFVPKSPVLVIHSKVDEVVPYQTSMSTWESWIEKGGDARRIKFHSLENASHEESAFEGIIIALDYLRQYR